jgi:hypothetical protein
MTHSMHLRDSTEQLRALNLAWAAKQQHDLETISAALLQRAKAIGEFAALADNGDLQAAFEAGRDVRRLLLEERRILLGELRCNQQLLKALEAGQCDQAAGSRTSVFA